MAIAQNLTPADDVSGAERESRHASWLGVISGEEKFCPALTSDPFEAFSSVKTSHFDIKRCSPKRASSLRNHPELVGPIRWLVRRGDLHAVLPGVYAPRPADTLIREFGL